MKDIQRIWKRTRSKESLWTFKVFILIFLSHKKIPSQYSTFYRLEITPCFDFVKHCGINVFPFCPSQAQNLESDGPPLCYFIPKFLQNSAWKWLNEVINSKSCKLAGISRRNITLHSWLAFPYSPSSSPTISDVGDTLKAYKHCAVLEKKNMDVEIKTLAPTFCSSIILVSYLPTLTVNFLKCKMGKIILHMWK